MTAEQGRFQRHWRHYRTEGGTRPVVEFWRALSDEAKAAIVVEMEKVRVEGLMRARHLRGEIYEVRVSHDGNAYRVLFAALGRFSHILLALECFKKTTQQTPPAKIELAEQRLADWRRQGATKKARAE
jgi:phage-related protein